MPYAASQSGFFVALMWLAVLGLVMTVVHLMQGEVLLRTEARHRLPGLARTYIGAWAGRSLLASEVVGLSASLLIYIVLGAAFLDALFPGNQNIVFLAVAFWCVFTIPEIFGLRVLAGLELVLTGALLVFLVAVTFFLVPHVAAPNLVSVAAPRLFLPYGVTLFALFGISGIPLVREVFGSSKGLGRVIVVGTALPVVLYAFFVFAVVGVTGQATSPEAIFGLGKMFGYPMVAAGAVMGLLAVSTSYLTLAAYVRDEIRLDLRIPRITSLGILVIPIAAFLLGVRDFIAIAAIAGTIIGAVDGSMVAYMWYRAKSRGDRKPEYKVPLPFLVSFGIIALFVGAAILELALIIF